jgi:phthiocerol/phenolphthiocerol synthesis type-I polyketide synthase E
VISREVSGGEPLEVDSIVIAEGGASTQRGSMEFGPRWHSLRRVDLGEREGLGSFELGEAFGEELQVYGLHPALLDFATSFLRLFRSEGSYLPLSYKRLRVVMPLPGRVYSHVRFIDEGSSPGVTLRFDVALMDEEGRGLVEIDEFAVIRVDDAAKLEAPSASFEASQFPWVGGDDASTALLREDLREGLSPAEGVEAFERILASGLPQVVVSPRDLLERIERSRSETLLSQVSGAVQKPKHPRPKLMTAYAAPRGKVERELAEIWQDVLGIEPVGVHDNFFDLGGDSLLVTRIHTRFVERFEQDVSVASLLQYPTIEDLSRFLSEQAREGEPSFEDVHEHVGQQKAALKRLKQKMRQKRAVDWTD